MNATFPASVAALRGRVSNIQRYSVHDGPGIRTTVFLKGCPLSCAWCHNPENIASRAEVTLFAARCVRCGKCLEVCPQAKHGGPVGRESIGLPAHGVAEAPSCLACGACVEHCPTGTRQMLGREMTVAELMEAVLADRIFYDESGGGVTFSGGEPLVQFEFLRAVLGACRQRGLRTAVDTCGFAPREHLLAIAPLADLFLYDLKLLDDARHREFCGVSNTLILENLQSLARVHGNLWLRVPIIPGVNDTDTDLDAVARFAATVPGVRQVNLLPYHKTGIHKFDRLGQDYRLPDVAPPAPAQMDAAAARFAAAGLKVKIGG